ncbi:hypothetical protein VNO77_14954 [Canavalia gladiata]|uniref:Uncharacterized protein n=1 Tax=Canavalia gladiata TaxID=3824 RepID=A0AAN9QS62_CANGL
MDTKTMQTKFVWYPCAHCPFLLHGTGFKTLDQSTPVPSKVMKGCERLPTIRPEMSHGVFLTNGRMYKTVSNFQKAIYVAYCSRFIGGSSWPLHIKTAYDIHRSDLVQFVKNHTLCGISRGSKFPAHHCQPHLILAHCTTSRLDSLPRWSLIFMHSNVTSGNNLGECSRRTRSSPEERMDQSLTHSGHVCVGSQLHHANPMHLEASV